jgi:hypothetical protein
MGRIVDPTRVATDEYVDAAFAKFRWRQRSSRVRALSDLARKAWREKPGEKNLARKTWREKNWREN